MSAPPIAVGQRGPTRSTSMPLTGENSIIATACTESAIPVWIVASGLPARITGTPRNVP